MATNKLIVKKRIPTDLLYWTTDNRPTCPPDGCWCRRIVTIPTKHTRKRIYVHAGILTKKEAKFIVKIHNEWLDQQKVKDE